MMRPGYFIAFLLALISFNVQAATNNRDAEFTTLADNYLFQFYFPNNPTFATTQGVHNYDTHVDDYSKNSILRQISQLKQFEKTVSSFNPKDLSLYAQGDRELVLNNIRSNLLTLTTIRPYEKDPDIYSSGATNAIFVLMERPFASVNDRLKLVIARENLIPALLNQAKKNLRNPPKIYTEIAIEQLPGIIKFFQTDVPKAFEQASNNILLAEFTGSNARVIRALQDYQQWLTTVVLPQSHGDFRLGKEVFRKKLQYDEMVDMSLDQLLALNLKNMNDNKKELEKLAKQIDPSKTPQQIIAELGSNHPAPDKLLSTFEDQLDHLIQFIQQKHIITIPSDVKPILEETPPFMRATTFASMDTPGPFEKNISEAYFNVTLPEPHWAPARVTEFMHQFNYPVISSIAIHETYPGHYVQFLWVPLVKGNVRKVLGASSNAEGWAHYAEQMMIEEGIGHTGNDPESIRKENLLKIGLIQESLLRNARFFVAIQMHTRQMSFDQAVDFFVNQGYQTRAVGTVETKRGTSNPMFLYYTLGKLQILKLRADMKAKLGDQFNLQKFHDDFMKEGFPPIKIVRRDMLNDDSPVL